MQQRLQSQFRYFTDNRQQIERKFTPNTDPDALEFFQVIMVKFSSICSSFEHVGGATSKSNKCLNFAKL